MTPHRSFIRPIGALLLAILSLLPGRSHAQNQSPSPKSATTLRAGVLSVVVDVSSHRLANLQLRDAISHRTFNLHEAFVLVLKDNTEFRSTAMRATHISNTIVATDPHQALRGAREIVQPPIISCWNFTSSTTTFDWCLILRPSSNYVRELLRIHATTADLPIAEVRLLDFSDSGAHTNGTVKGSPVVDANMFFGFEHPLSINSANNGDVRASLFRDLPLRAGQSIIYSAVLGTSQPGQLRRAFLAYIESERPRPYKPFLHYNSWYDLGLGFGDRFDETDAIDRINAFGQQLVAARHVQLDSFLFDDGWDNPNSLWGFDSGFPNGFTKTGEAAAQYKAGIGVWLSPWGGYREQRTARIAYGRAHGYEIMNNGFALSGPKYYQLFQQTCLEMIDKYHVNQFKFDGTGNANRVFPDSAFDSDFDAAIHLIERLRQQKPSIFINLTTGTTASPFWLFYADSIWRGGGDHDFSGVGTQRQRWITYRDAQTYKNIVLQGPLYPLNSLMLHGIIYARHAKGLSTDPNNDFADEVHSYFGTGTQLQEMYLTPSLLTKANWDTLAEAARWSRVHAATLKDVHWIGGDPDQLQVYGWAAWSPREGIITLRNPSTAAQTFDIDVAKLFELQPIDPASYDLHSVWSDSEGWNRNRIEEAHTGKLLTVHLAPFEVLTLNARPTP